MDSTTYGANWVRCVKKITIALLPCLSTHTSSVAAKLGTFDHRAVGWVKEHPLKEYPTHGQYRRKCEWRKLLYLYGNGKGRVKSVETGQGSPNERGMNGYSAACTVSRE